MDQLPPLWPSTGDVVIIKLTRGDRFEIAVCPEAAQIGCESYDDAWSTARTLAESTAVDVWFTRPAATGRLENELRLLGHYRRRREIEQEATRSDNTSASTSEGECHDTPREPFAARAAALHRGSQHSPSGISRRSV